MTEPNCNSLCRGRDAPRTYHHHECRRGSGAV